MRHGMEGRSIQHEEHFESPPAVHRYQHSVARKVAQGAPKLLRDQN
jgi:hypothetical protein